MILTLLFFGALSFAFAAGWIAAWVVLRDEVDVLTEENEALRVILDQISGDEPFDWEDVGP